MAKPKRKGRKVTVRGLRERPSGAVVCLTAYVPVGLAQAVKLRAASSGRTVSALVIDALQALP